MRKQIEDALNVLKDQALSSTGHAADLAWFQFGQRRTVKNYRSDDKVVGEYALHVQTSWRILHEDRVIVGSSDLYDPATKNIRSEDIDPIVSTTTRLDSRLTELFENETRQFLTRHIHVGRAGSFSLILDDDYALEVFPDDSSNREHWRLFSPYRDMDHFIFPCNATNGV